MSGMGKCDKCILSDWLTSSTTSQQLSKYHAFNQFESQTSVPKVYIVLGLAGLYFFLIFFNIAGEFLVNLAGFAIPGYYSLEALFSVSKSDDTQWLTVRGSSSKLWWQSVN